MEPFRRHSMAQVREAADGEGDASEPLATNCRVAFKQ